MRQLTTYPIIEILLIYKNKRYDIYIHFTIYKRNQAQSDHSFSVILFNENNKNKQQKYKYITFT